MCVKPIYAEICAVYKIFLALMWLLFIFVFVVSTFFLKSGSICWLLGRSIRAALRGDEVQVHLNFSFNDVCAREANAAYRFSLKKGRCVLPLLMQIFKGD